MLTKTTRIMELTGAGNSRITFSQYDEETGFMLSRTQMKRELWEDLGKPEVVTMTIEPGDKLN